jgi:hypothetical protein
MQAIAAADDGASPKSLHRHSRGVGSEFKLSHLRRSQWRRFRLELARVYAPVRFDPSFDIGIPFFAPFS